MREIQLLIADDLPSVLDGLYRQFGIWKMARAVAAASWRHGREAGGVRSFAGNRLEDLSERVLRDIGLDANHRRLVEDDWRRQQ